MRALRPQLDAALGLSLLRPANRLDGSRCYVGDFVHGVMRFDQVLRRAAG